MDNGRFGPRFALTRRGFLVFASSCLVTVAGRVAGAQTGPTTVAAGDVDLGRFMRMSRVLTAMDDLRDEAAGRLYLEALSSRREGAARLAALWEVGGFGGAQPPTSVADLEARGMYDDPSLAELADTITGNWYSGTYVDADGRRRVATYTNAMAWRTLGYRPAGPSSCGGAFGHWADQPAV